MKELVYPRLLLPRAERLADKTAFIDVTREGVAYEGTLGRHVERVLRLCRALRTELGLERGDRFGVLALNGHAFIELYHAALFGAGVVNPLNIRFSPAELAYVLADSGTRLVFTDAIFAPVLHRAVVEEGARLDRVVVIGEGEASVGATTPLRYEDLLGGGDAPVPPEPDEDDPVVLMYTGGTTGRPKGAVLDQRAEVLNTYHVAMAIGLDEDRRFLFQSPMFHAAVVAGVLAVPASGAVSVSVPLFDAGLVLDVVTSQRIDATVVVPVMLTMLEQVDGFDPARLRPLRQLMYGAAPIADAALQRWLDWLPGTDFFQGYGMTEAASVVSFLGPEDHRRGGDLLRSAGVPVVGVELRVEDDSGAALDRGGGGEICVRGGNLMQGYWNRPEETAAALRGGWYHTGDVGFVDEGGHLFLTDRANDMIVTGGENVYSTEVESVLAAHPAVGQVAVIGIPDDQWGEAVHAVVVLKPGATASAKELMEFGRSRLSGYKVPKSVEFRTTPLPLSGAFKPLKRELRMPYWEGRDRSRRMSRDRSRRMSRAPSRSPGPGPSSRGGGVPPGRSGGGGGGAARSAQGAKPTPDRSVAVAAARSPARAARAAAAGTRGGGVGGPTAGRAGVAGRLEDEPRAVETLAGRLPGLGVALVRVQGYAIEGHLRAPVGPLDGAERPSCAGHGAHRRGPGRHGDRGPQRGALAGADAHVLLVGGVAVEGHPLGVGQHDAERSHLGHVDHGVGVGVGGARPAAGRSGIRSRGGRGAARGAGRGQGAGGDQHTRPHGPTAPARRAATPRRATVGAGVAPACARGSSGVFLGGGHGHRAYLLTGLLLAIVVLTRARINHGYGRIGPLVQRVRMAPAGS